MALDNINIGSSANDGTGDTIRDAFGKVNTNNTKTLTNDVADYSNATTPLAGTELALVEQGGTFKKVAVSDIGGSGSKKSFTIEIPVSQGLAASTSWYTRNANTQNIFNATFTTNANLTDVNDFANHGAQTTCNIVPFNCRIKSVQIRGNSNVSATDIRVVILKSDATTTNAFIQAPVIIADKTFNTHSPSVNQYYADWSDLEMNLTEDCLKGSQIRMLIFNNNVASNLFTTVCLIEFEEI